jgi:hypothetical protein
LHIAATSHARTLSMRVQVWRNERKTSWIRFSASPSAMWNFREAMKRRRVRCSM